MRKCPFLSPQSFLLTEHSAATRLSLFSLSLPLSLSLSLSLSPYIYRRIDVYVQTDSHTYSCNYICMSV